ncbi:MAG TPA: HAD-IA family hydrolase, partial [Sphaerochaeta sp.]|nr:HAD-IA family hydrolase [Sphaerochaeta sp.]HQB54300.1 HAD-IA family hydrolase [Sphaerochaeta sp.]
TFFDYYIISGVLKVNKPDGAIYEHLIAVSDTKPSEILFIDDLMRNVQAAQAAGMHAIRYRGMDALKCILKDEYPSLV